MSDYSNGKIKVIIADDYPQFIEGIKLVLSTNTKFQIIDECSDGQELVLCTNLHRANVMLIDLDMPKLNGLEAAKHINMEYPHIPLIAVTMHKDEIYLLDVICAGFKGFVYKPETAENLLRVIDEVLSDKFIFPKTLKIE